MEYGSFNVNECHDFGWPKRCLDISDRGNSYSGQRYEGDPERRRTGQKHLLANFQCCGYWNDCTLSGSDIGQKNDRHEDGRIGKRQTIGTNGGNSPTECGYTACPVRTRDHHQRTIWSVNAQSLWLWALRLSE